MSSVIPLVLLVILFLLVRINNLVTWSVRREQSRGSADPVSRSEFEALRGAHEIDRISWDGSRRRFEAALEALAAQGNREGAG